MIGRNLKGGIIIALLVCGGIFFFAQGQAFARWEMVSGDLLKTAKKYYEQQQYKEAIREYSKVLLIDPHQKEALEYLKKMGLEGGVYGTYKNEIDQVFELNQEISAYQQDLERLMDQAQAQQQHNRQLEQQKHSLEQAIAQKEAEKEQVIAAHEELRAVSVMKIREQQEHIDDLQESRQGQAQDIARLSTDLFEMRTRTAEHQDVIAKQEAKLQDMQDMLDKTKKISEEELRVLRLKYDEHLAVLEDTQIEKDQEMSQIAADFRDRLRKFNKALIEKETQLKMEKNLSAVKSYRIAQQEAGNLELRKQLKEEYTQKQTLYGQAELLTREIQKLKRKLTFRMTNTRKDPDEKLRSYIRKQDDVIGEMKIRLATLLTEIELLDNDGEGKDGKQVQEMTQQVGDLKKEIAEKEKELKFSEEKQNILKSRLEELQERLDIVQGMIRDKEKRILFLEQNLGTDVYPGDSGDEDGRF